MNATVADPFFNLFPRLFAQLSLAHSPLLRSGNVRVVGWLHSEQQTFDGKSTNFKVN